MDIADDIAYSIHDLEDFSAQGTIDLRRVAAEIDRAHVALTTGSREREANNVFVIAEQDLSRKKSEFWDEVSYLRALERVAFLFRTTAEDLLQPDAGLFVARLRDLLSLWVNEFFDALRCDGTNRKPPVYLNPPAWHTMQVLKLVTKRFLVFSPAVAQIQRAQIQAMTRLFDGLILWLNEASTATVLPVGLQEIMANQQLKVAAQEPGKALRDEHYRAVSDYICTLSDAEALELSQWLAGHTVPGAMYGG